MMPSGLLYRSARALNTASKCSSTRSSLPSALGSIRSFTISRPLLKNHDLPGHNDENQGTMARTDKQVQIEHPKEENYPSSKPFQGSGGKHLLRTLAGFSLEGRVAIITGGARGLGLVMAQALVISGADVALVDLNKEECQNQADNIVQHFIEENPDAEHIPKVTAHYSDVSDPESVNACVNEVIEAHGKVDHLVTSAGFTENFDAIEYPYERLKKLWAVNVDGTYLFATAVGRHLIYRKSKGSIVTVGSMSGVVVNVPQPQAPYNASKAAVRQLTASLAVEWAHAGIRVNCISPGYMLTALTRKIMKENPDLERQWTSLIPQGRIGSPEDLMGGVVYLLSDAAAYTTGSHLVIDGGYTVT